MSTAIESAQQAKTVMPNLTVDDLPASLRFFEGLGFAVEERWEDNGTLHGVMLRAGNVQIGLSQDDWKKGRNRTKAWARGSSSRPRKTSTRLPRAPSRLASH